jgi:hypothetical protein
VGEWAWARDGARIWLRVWERERERERERETERESYAPSEHSPIAAEQARSWCGGRNTDR